MTVRAFSPLHWTLPAGAHPGEMPAHDLSALGAHYQNCQGCKGRWFSIRCAAEAVNAFVAPRFVTTLLAIGTVAAIAAAVL